VSALLPDLVLAVAIPWLAWAALSGRDLFRSVVVYIVFGLVMALAWVRLQAPDIALAEAAIGAGLTGALLLDAVAQLGGAEEEREWRGSWLTGAGAALATVVLAGVLLAVVWRLPEAPGGLTAEVAAAIPESGVGHPVTAVLLNFRAFDTWLEVGVLLIAVLAVLAVRQTHTLSEVPVEPVTDPVLAGAARLLVPPMVLVGGYLLWLGTHAPGGAFQSGAVLAAALVLLLLAGHRSVTALRAMGLRLLLLAGLLAFLAVAVGTLLAGDGLLVLPPRWAGTLILGVETAVTVSIALTLAVLFAGARGVRTRAGGA
jgi:multisubunit Na+/H+ antiporter MnhB subunit